MFECTVVCPKAKSRFADYIGGVCEKFFSRVEGKTTVHRDDENIFLCYACRDLFCDQAEDVVKDAVCDVLCSGYKYDFFCEKLGEPTCFMQRVLLGTMSCFDCVADKKQLYRALDLTKMVVLDGYFNFAMRQSVEKWKDVADLTQENSLLLKDKDLCVEFLSYLCESSPSSCGNVSLEFCDDDYHIFGADNRIYPKKPCFALSADKFERAAVEMIRLKPTLLTIYTLGEEVNEDFLSLMSSLFKVKVVENS